MITTCLGVRPARERGPRGMRARAEFVPSFVCIHFTPPCP